MLWQWVTPEIGYRSHCDCDTCSCAKELYFCEDEHPMRKAWEDWWAKLERRRVRQGQLTVDVCCVWQLRRVIAATAAAAQLELGASWGVAGAPGPNRPGVPIRSRVPPT